MTLISRSAPVYASSGTATLARDATTATSWEASSVPAWLAYDLSAVATNKRQQVLVALYTPYNAYFQMTGALTRYKLPLSYRIEVNSAAGGGSPPQSGWNIVTEVTANTVSSPQHLIAINGANWIRVYVLTSSQTGVGFDMDVYSADSGANDDWLLKGDSISWLTLQRYKTDVPQQVYALDSTRWPAIVLAAVGGSNTTTSITNDGGTSVTATALLDMDMQNFPGKYVVLAFGTNDAVDNFQMETLVQQVINAGKTPVIPHAPWSSSSTYQTKLASINALIDALYVKYPQIVPGPDLWTVFQNHSDYLLSDQIHPSTTGEAALRQAWAQFIASIH